MACFDTVVCKGLSVVDKAGNPRIMLGMGEHSSIGILNETGKIVAYLADHKKRIYFNAQSPFRGISCRLR